MWSPRSTATDDVGKHDENERCRCNMKMGGWPRENRRVEWLGNGTGAESMMYFAVGVRLQQIKTAKMAIWNRNAYKLLCIVVGVAKLAIFYFPMSPALSSMTVTSNIKESCIRICHEDVEVNRTISRGACTNCQIDVSDSRHSRITGT